MHNCSRKSGKIHKDGWQYFTYTSYWEIPDINKFINDSIKILEGFRDTDKNDVGPGLQITEHVHNISKIIDSTNSYPKEWAEKILNEYYSKNN